MKTIFRKRRAELMPYVAEQVQLQRNRQQMIAQAIQEADQDPQYVLTDDMNRPPEADAISKNFKKLCRHLNKEGGESSRHTAEELAAHFCILYDL